MRLNELIQKLMKISSVNDNPIVTMVSEAELENGNVHIEHTLTDVVMSENGVRIIGNKLRWKSDD